MTPGRSLSPNTIGRSIAPAASTARLATMRHSRWRGCMRGRLGHMVVDPLDRGIGAAVIDAEHGGAAQDAAVGQAFELGLGRLDPVERGTPVDLVALGEQPPAETEILLAQDHPRAGARGGERRRQAGGPAADHQHVAEGVGLVVMVGVRRVRRRGRAPRRGG